MYVCVLNILHVRVLAYETNSFCKYEITFHDWLPFDRIDEFKRRAYCLLIVALFEGDFVAAGSALQVRSYLFISAMVLYTQM